jgi:hypothetical protein
MSATPSPAHGRTTTADGATDRKASSGHEEDQVELADMITKPPLPVEEDVMQLARLGEIGAIQKLFDAGKCDATYTDEQGITPLHVRLFLEGAESLLTWCDSGPQSTTTTPSAISSSPRAQTSTPKAVML